MNSQLILLLIVFILNINVNGQVSDKIKKETKNQSLYALDLCKYLHQHPELSLLEFQTSKRMAAELKKIGLEVTENFGGNSVIGILKNGVGPVVMLRTDMDALPMEEKTGLDFASVIKSKDASGKETPVMHACGHDIHMSVLTGTLRTLVALKKEWKGTLMVIAQQAEEISGGATNAIEAGLFSKFPVPDYAMAFHINPELASGKIGLVRGSAFAGVKTVEIVVYGKGGHGAYPEKCIDPIVIASRIVLDLQTIVSRERSPLEPIVVTVGSIHGGTRPNIIPDEVKLELTLRYYSFETIEKVIESVKRICKFASQMAGMPDNQLPDVKVLPVETPPVLNNIELSKKIDGFASEIIGTQNVLKVKPSMVAEDFGKYGLTPEKVPICLLWLGSSNPELLQELEKKGERPAPLHSPYLKPDYATTIVTGIQVMTRNVIGLLKADK
ncbi:MAG: amidohydrolase [Mariniphaga sp.]